MKVYELRNHIKSMVISSDYDKSYPITSDFDGESKLKRSVKKVIRIFLIM